MEDDFCSAFIIPPPWEIGATVSSLRKNIFAANSLRNSHIWAQNWPRGIILRSSAVKETLMDRGAYVSCELPADYNVESIGNVIQSMFEDFSQAKADGGFSIILQPLVPNNFLGHCSNERRVSKTINQWEWSLENDPSHSGRYNTQRALLPNEKEALRVEKQKQFNNVLKSIGRWCTELNRGPTHLEWCVSDKTLFLLQIDFEDECPDEGVNPRELIRDDNISPPDSGPHDSYIQEIEFDGKKYGWGKVDVVPEFKAVRDEPYAKLFMIDGKKLQQALKNKEKLIQDIKSITHDHAVFRTACNNSKIPKHNLPRTDTTKAEDAVTFLEDTLDKLISHGASPEEVCFIMHKFIPARAAAWALADPKKQIVRIDSLWGVPDGLQYYPHDSFQVDVKLKKVLSVRNRYKPFFIQELENGYWEQVSVKRRYVRSQSLHTKDLLEIAKQTQSLAVNKDGPVQVMWFCDISRNAKIGRNLPWYMEPAEVSKSARSAIPKKPKFLIRNLEDISKAETEAKDHILLLQPEAQLVRNDDFIDKVAALAKKKDLP